MSTVYKRKGSPYWWLSYRVPNHPKRVSISSKTTSHRKARQLLSRREEEAWQGNYFPERLRDKVTLHTLVDRWLAHHKQDKSHKDQVSRSRKMLKDFGPVLASAIDPLRIVEWRDALLASGRSPATVNRYLSVCKSVLTLAYEDKMIQSNPAKRVKLLKERNYRNRLCSPEEYQQLLGAAPERLRLCIRLAYTLGLRRGNIVNLLSSEVHLTEPYQIRITGHRMKSGRPFEIPFGDDILQALRAFPSQQGSDTLEGYRIMGNYQGIQCSKDFRKLCKGLGIKGLRFHDLRHTFATRLKDSGVDSLVVSALLDHASLSTLRRYYKVTHRDKVAAIASAKAASKK